MRNLLLVLLLAAGMHAQTQAERWDAVYSQKDFQFNTRPNAFLMEVIKGCPPGKALDIGMGQGRNSIFLAQAGWDVTGVDISAQGIRVAAAEAARLGLKLITVLKPIEDYDMGNAQWDLIVGMYVHPSVIQLAARIQRALKPGGILVIEGFHADVMKMGATPVSGAGTLGFRTNALVRVYEGLLRIERYEDRVGFGDWMNKESPIVRMLARKE